MSAKKKDHGGGGHSAGWIVTFADLVSLLMAFFVMVVSFSNQDQEKLQQAAGSMRDAFGYQALERPAGMIEMNGLPVRDYAATTGRDTPDDVEFATERNDDRALQGPEVNTHDIAMAEAERAGQFVTAAMSLRQALADLPDIAALSRQIALTETEDGLDIRLMDQDLTEMFAAGSAQPTERLRQIIARIAPVIAGLPNRVRITGHTAQSGERSRPGDAAWTLSSDRALAVAQLFAAGGVSGDQVEAIIGKADTEPLFPNDPYLAGNRRIDIVLLYEPPPLPPDIAP